MEPVDRNHRVRRPVRPVVRRVERRPQRHHRARHHRGRVHRLRNARAGAHAGQRTVVSRTAGVCS